MAYICFKFTYTIPTFPQKSSDTTTVRFPNAFRCLEKFQELEAAKKKLHDFQEKLGTEEVSGVLRFFYGIQERLLAFRVRSWKETYRLAIEEALRKARQGGSLEEWSTRENCAGEYLLATPERGWDIYRCFRKRNPARDWVSRSSSVPTLVLVAA